MSGEADPLQRAIALHQQGHLSQAEQVYQEILQNNPRHAEALHLSGLAAHQLGRHGAALGAIRRAIEVRPQVAQFHVSLGDVYRSLSRLEEARASYEAALRLDRSAAAAHFHLGSIHLAAGNWDDARRAFQEAVRLKPDFIEARRRLARSQWACGELAAAAAGYAETLRLEPGDVDTLLRYSRLLEIQSRGEESLRMADRAVELNPELARAHAQRGRSLAMVSRPDAAVAAFRESLRRDPTAADVYLQLSTLLSTRLDPDGAIEACRRGLEIEPANADFYNVMGLAFREQGNVCEAIECFRKVLAIRPDDARAHSSLLYSLNFLEGVDSQALFEEHLEWSRRHAEPLTARASAPENDPTPDRRLKIGYVSPHFRSHAVHFFVEPILQSHDHGKFEIYCYASYARAFPPDRVSERLQALAEQWRDVSSLSDEQLAALVRRDGIDILVDLCGHIGQPRLLAFARKAAPVQVTYIGYQATTGMSAMDYRLTDERADPPGMTDAYYTERLVRLPRSFFCYKPSEAPRVNRLPALESDRVTFGSFNDFCKLTPRVLDAWMEILGSVPNSRLLVLACPPGSAGRRVLDAADNKGIEPARVVLRGRCPQPEYLRLVQQTDIALDPIPFNGHTTTCDAIWMGVPVVMLEGSTYASRFGGCVLAQAGLERLIARSVDEYIDIATRLASDLKGLSQLRGQLRSRMARSPILDFAGFTRNLEDAYRQMWIEWCHSRQGT